MTQPTKALPLNLALQGGGSHGAFTWGVLDRLLEDGRFRFPAVSAASAGAVNAVAMADGLAAGGPDEARERLLTVWEAIIDAGVPGLFRGVPSFAGAGALGEAAEASFRQLSSAFSPYSFNPLNINPLRDILTRQIDFERLRATATIELLISATEVATGRGRLFRRAEMDVNVILASTCLPNIFQAVTIDGVAYWDGGFSANPDILTLARERYAPDTLLVLLNPVVRDQTPRSFDEIAGEVGRLTFNRPMRTEVERLAAIRRSGPLIALATGDARVARHRFHMIDAAAHINQLSPTSKMRADDTLVRRLFEAGRADATDWIDADSKDVGRRETADLISKFGV